MIGLGIEHIGFAVQLIIDLPADHCGMIPVPLGQLFHHPAHILPINRRIVIIVPALPMTVQGAVHFCVQDFGMRIDQPGGRGSGGRPEDHPDLFFQAQGKEAVKDFCVCNAFKYLWRHNAKNGDEDIKKANWYLNKAVEIMKGGQHEKSS